VRVWDAATGDPITRPLRHSDEVTGASFSPDGQQVITASLDESARVWDAVTGDPITASLKHPAHVLHASFSPDGRHIVTATEFKVGIAQTRGGTARVWHPAAGKVIATFEHPRGSVLHASFSPDGSRVATSHISGRIHVWDLAKGGPAIAVMKHSQTVHCAFFSPNGRLLVSASRDHTARVWEADTGEPITPPLRHSASVKHASFSPDSQFVVTASRDHTARVWEADTGAPITPPLNHTASVNRASFSPDGQFVVTASWDGAARVWRLPTPDNRPLSDLALMGELLSAKRLHTSGTLMPIDPLALRAALCRLQSAYPSEFVASPDQVLVWRRQKAAYLNNRALANCQEGQWASAVEGLSESIKIEPDREIVHYWHALACLGAGDQKGYRDGCARMVQQFAGNETASAGNWLAQSCALAPMAVSDLAKAVKAAEHAVSEEPNSDQQLKTLGAVLYRAGRYEEAVERLTELDRRRETADGAVQSSPAYTWYFLAMAHQEAGNAEQAREYLNKANQWTDRVLADKEKQPAWNRRATLELLRTEAEAMIEEKAEG
jgi:tetratricopeptide (TPR) repeat protein